MIYGRLEDLDSERNLYPEALRRALDFLASTDFAGREPGRIDIDGERLFAILAEDRTQPADEGQWEVHRKYVDVQCLLDGKEVIGFAREREGLEIEADALEEEDCLYYLNVGAVANLYLEPGHYAVFFPRDIHRPLCAADRPAPVRKIIVKIAVELFKSAAL